MAVNAEQNQQKNQEELTSQGTTASPVSGGTPAAPVQSRVANFSSGSQPQSGSGRFTNLQNYINANKGASERLASGISSNLDKETATQKRDVGNQAASVREGIQAAQNKLGTGQQYLNQVKGQDFNAQSITNDPTKLQEFTGFRTNQAVGAQNLGNQTTQALTAAQQLQQAQQQQLQNASTETGRFNLLKNAFGGGSVYQNPYSTGQQRLDQLFLQAGGANNVNNIQNQVRGGLNQTGQTLNTLGQNAGTIGTIGTQAQELAKGLQDTTTGLTNQFVSGVEGTADQVNAQRATDQAWAQDQYTKLQSGQPIDQKFAQMLGLSQGQNLYNSLTGKNVNDFVNFGPTQLQGFGQLANAQQEQQYSALAQLAGMTPGYELNGDPVAAAATIPDALKNASTAARSAFDAKLYNTSGTGDIASNQLSGTDIGKILDTKNPQDIMNLIRSAQVPTGGYNTGNTAYMNLLGEIARTKQPNATGGIGYANANQALVNLLNSGYFNGVNIMPPSDTESGGQFGVS